MNVTEKKTLDICRCFKKSDFENKHILFLGCGDGDEIEALINYYNLKSAKITGIDLNENALKNCNRLINKFPNIKIFFRKVDFDDIEKIAESNFDYIITIGIFDKETLEADYAANLLKKINTSLNFSFLINSAYSFELFTKEEYKSFGFKVLQTCNPKSLYTHDYCFLYLLSKT